MCLIEIKGDIISMPRDSQAILLRASPQYPFRGDDKPGSVCVGRSQMKQAVAAFAATWHPLAQHHAIPREHCNARLPPRCIVKMNEARLLTGGDFIAQFHERFEQA